MPAWGDWKSDDSAGFARTFSAKSYYGGEASRSSQCRWLTHEKTLADTSDCTDEADLDRLLDDLDDLAERLEKHQLKFKLDDLRQLMYRCAGHLVKAESVSASFLLPFRLSS